MIGTNIRSVRHLFRVSDTSLKTVLIKFRENVCEVCKTFKTPKDSPFGECLFIFNNVYKQTHWNFDTITSSETFKKHAKFDDVMRYSRLIGLSASEFQSMNGIIQEITLLPDSFDADYEKFLKENSKMINGLMSSIGFDTHDSKTKRLYIYSDGSKNFFQWAVIAFYRNRVALSTIKNIFLWNESYKQLAKNLSKGTITAYTSKDSIMPLMKEMSDLRKEKRINDSINSFNTAQKKMLKENELSNDIKQALWRLSRLSDTKRLNFIKKMSSVTDFNELARQLKFVTSVHFSWSKESFMDFIDNVEEIKYEKIYENDNVVLVKILDYETVKQLGKTTNWCISKNKHYWNNYIENYHGQTTQYMVFDFSKVEDDKLSIIGFTTTHNRGITSAHNFINEDLMGNNQNTQVLLNSFIARFNESRNIYSILGELGVDITLIVEYDMPQYEWDRESLMKYLYECVNQHNVDILMSKDDKIVLSVTDQNLCYFFGDTYQDNISRDYYSSQHILFIDFSKNKYDINKIQFAIIEEGYGDEDYCNGVYNERCLNNGNNFDSLLIEYGLPYNTIRRTNNPIVRLRNAICSFNTPMIKDCMKECSKDDLVKTIRNEVGQDAMYDFIIRSVDGFMSFDYFDILYENGIKLKSFMSFDYMGDIIKHFASNMRNVSRATDNFTNMEGVTESEIKDFYELKTRRREDAKYVGYYLAIKKLIDNEDLTKTEANSLYRKFLSYMDGVGKQVEVFEQILDLFKESLDYNNRNSPSIVSLARYIVFYGSKELKEYATKKGENNQFFKEQLERYYKDYDRLFNNKKEKNSTSSFRISTDGTFTTVTTNQAVYATPLIDEMEWDTAF